MITQYRDKHVITIDYLWASWAVSPERSRGGVAVSTAASQKRIVPGAAAVAVAVFRR